MKSVFPPASQLGSSDDSVKKNKTPQSSGVLNQTLHTFWSWAFLIVALGAIGAGLMVFREADQNVVFPPDVQAQVGALGSSVPSASAATRYLDEVFSQVTVTSNIAYSQSEDEFGQLQTHYLDMYEPTGDTEELRPLIIWVHGGGFFGGDKATSNMVTYAEAFAKRGYVTVSANYRLVEAERSEVYGSPSFWNKAHDAQSDLQAAVRFFRANASLYRIDPSRIAMAGASAGAVTSLEVAYNWENEYDNTSNPGYSSKIQTVATVSGGVESGHMQAGDPPVSIHHSTDDQTVPYSEAIAVRDQAISYGIPYEFYTYTNGHTIFGLNSTEIIGRMDDFFYLHLVLGGNYPPTANAGVDQVKSDGDGNGMESVTLSASGSSDPDGTIVSYEWKEGVNILGASATTILDLAAGIHTLTLTVTDDDGYTDTDEVQVTVNPNQVPVANAGIDQNIGIGQVVNFSGAGSTDADGTIVSYAWDFGDTATSTEVNVSHPYLVAGNYTATLLVMDNAGATSTDTAIINVIANQPPVASAGPDQNVTDSDGNGSQSVTLNGGGSSDPDGSIVSYEWKEGAVVVGTGATPSASLAVGAHTITLTVTDNGGAQSSDTVLITVNPQPAPQTTLYFSLASNGTVGGVSVANEDIIAFTGSQFSIYFDGSDVGVGSLTLDAFSVLSSSEILMSFTDAATIPGISGTVDDSDVVKFSSASLRESTSGSFSMYFDASDVGLSTNDEDIDAVELLADGRVLVSTTGSFSVTGLSGEDEDLIALTPTSLGGTTAGTWAMYFDGSDVSLTLNDEDVDAAAVTANGSIYLSTIGNFAVTGISGADEDIFIFNPNTLGATTAGSFSPTLFFDGSVWGLSSNDLFAIDLP